MLRTQNLVQIDSNGVSNGIKENSIRSVHTETGFKIVSKESGTIENGVSGNGIMANGVKEHVNEENHVKENGVGPIKSGFDYDEIRESADFILKNTKHRPKIGIICGSGLGPLADTLDDKEEFPYETVPNFPVSTVKGHAGKLVLGQLAGVTVLCMQGRFHVYEGYPLWKCAMPVRVMKLMGIGKIIVTNAAGGLNPDYKVGDIMIIKDHVNIQGFAGDSPLRGRNDERFGPRFPSLNNAYDRELRSMAMDTAKELGIQNIIREGVYVMVGGPTYETPAELRLLRVVGVDAVGMSTVHEVIVARHCGLKVFAFSLVTNKCVTEYETDQSANHAEVIDIANKRQKDLQKLVENMVKKMESM